MSAIPYTYSVIRYVHDPAAEEMLNIGVLLYAPSVQYLSTLIEHRYERLSKTFAGFDGEHYRRTLRQFEAATDRIRQSWEGGLFGPPQLPADAGAVGSQIWPDQDLSFRLGPVLAGLTDDPEVTLHSLFERMVGSQYVHGRPETRSDDDIWAVYHPVLARERVASVLRPRKFATPEFELEFQHAFRNDHWHVLQPVSMDHARAEYLQHKAAVWLGNATALRDNRELDRLYLLLGPPRLEAHRTAYIKAKNLLHKMPIPHDLVEEQEADAFARELAGYMQEHGVIDKEQEE
jgi:hypothetical protein